MARRRDGGVAEWLGLMQTSVKVALIKSTGRSAFGVAGYSTSVTTYRARYSAVTARMKSLDGYDSSIKGVLWVASTSTGNIRTDSKITLPDGTVPSIIDVEYPRDETGGVHHTKVLLG